jgi:GxxExxY protein
MKKLTRRLALTVASQPSPDATGFFQRLQLFRFFSGSTVQRFQKEPHMADPYVKPQYPLSDVTARIIAAAQEVHLTLGPGFEEVIYQRALARELPAHDLEFSREVWIDVLYKGGKVGHKRVDFVVDQVMVEIKAKAVIEAVDVVQSLSYLKASGYTVGLLLNFGATKLEIKRLANRA